MKGVPTGLTVDTVVAFFKMNPKATIHEAAKALDAHPATLYLRVRKAREQGLLAGKGRHRAIGLPA